MPESLDKQREVIRDAFYSQFGEGGLVAQPPANAGWIAEVFDDHVIGEFGDNYFKIPYSESGDEITFVGRDEWTEVEEKREWITKIKDLKLRSSRVLKTISKTATELRVGNYIALFGGKDLEGEHFTKSTDFESSYTKTGVLYVDWEHGMGQELDSNASPGPNDILGYVDWKTAKPDEMGLWVERVLDRRNIYMNYIEVLIDAGMIANSTEALIDGIEKTKSGEIEKWPLKRDTLTVAPMEPRMMTSNVIGAVKGLAKAYPHLEALLLKESGDSTRNVTADDEGGEYQHIQLQAQAMLVLD